MRDGPAILPSNPFAAAGYSGQPDCRMGRAFSDADVPLTQAEQQRVARLQSEAGQRELHGSLVVRRKLIAQIAGCDPGNISLTATADGAPILENPEGWTVSLANKSDVTVVALRRAPAEIGIDLEIVKEIHWAPILSMTSSEEERRQLEAQISAHPVPLRAFFRMWTLKEAVLKATRLGFRAGPKAIQTPFRIIAAPGTGELSAFGQTYRFWSVDVDVFVVSLVERSA